MRLGHFTLSEDFRDAQAASRQLRYLRQLGIDDLVLVEHPYDRCEMTELVRLREICEGAGMRLLSIENIAPQHAVLEPIILGRPERDASIELIQRIVRTMGRVGIPYYGLHWHVPPVPERGNGVLRTSFSTRGRGDALVTSFELAALDGLELYRERAFTEEELWDNYAYFLRAVLPVAEEAGVTLGLHPHDPPIHEPLGGVPRLFASLADFQRAEQLAQGSPSWGITFCLGNWHLMGDADLYGAIEHFGSRSAINYVHVQAVRGGPRDYTECFFEEADCDFGRVVRALSDVGYEGTLVPSHMPALDGDAADKITWAERATAYAAGYLQALLRSARD